ncbi:hypothetical protein [Alicyclobacillus dauci]|uniref:Uncharacterized protein n=1 Tax=Alicyclobacillus dauci TaxID=1475485 RepID=A0ABY6YWV4_9BACL|nr:hypothetical protein [Alicyclobacillus dauci]WAH35022.1 hypothetical protein NZD86_11850 [Alicyclobacillus dauci]
METAATYGAIAGLWILLSAGVAGCLILIYHLYMYVFDLMLQAFKLHSLFRDFIWYHYNKRPPSEQMSEEEAEKLKRELGRST